MISRTVKGNIVKMAKAGEFDVICQGCNCFNTMGAGVALQIKQEFPEAYRVDCTTRMGDRNKLGTVSIAHCKSSDGSTPVDIVNAYTQYDYRGYKPVDYNAIADCFTIINNLYGEYDLRIGIPMIGAGLAGGDWHRIEKIINECAESIDITLVEYEGN